MNSKILPQDYVLRFGQFKGTKASDPSVSVRYLKWLLTTNWLKDKEIINEVIKMKENQSKDDAELTDDDKAIRMIALAKEQKRISDNKVNKILVA